MTTETVRGSVQILDSSVTDAKLETTVSSGADANSHLVKTNSAGYVSAVGINVNTTGAGAGEVKATDITTTGDIKNVAWADYSASSTIVGWASFTTKQIYYKKVGKLVFIQFDISGVSDTTTVTFTLPYSKNSGPGNMSGTLGVTTDNSTVKTTPGRWALSGSTVTCYSDCSTGAWTASNGKNVRGEFFYESA